MFSVYRQPCYSISFSTKKDFEIRTKMFLPVLNLLNHFYLQSNTFCTFPEDAKLLIRSKEREVAVAQESAEVEIKNNLQQMKHLQYENHTRLGEIRAETMTQLKLSQEDHFAQELELYNDKRALKRLLREKEETTELEKQELKMKISKLLR